MKIENYIIGLCWLYNSLTELRTRLSHCGSIEIPKIFRLYRDCKKYILLDVSKECISNYLWKLSVYSALRLLITPKFYQPSYGCRLKIKTSLIKKIEYLGIKVLLLDL